MMRLGSVFSFCEGKKQEDGEIRWVGDEHSSGHSIHGACHSALSTFIHVAISLLNCFCKAKIGIVFIQKNVWF